MDGACVGEIAKGFLVLLGVHKDDTESDLATLAEKVAVVRAFEDAAGKMNLALGDVGGAVLLVSQFTLLADTKHGRRPSFTEAKEPLVAKAMVERFADALKARGLTVEQGVFGADMRVELCNEGPVTLMLDTAEWKRGKAE